MGGQSILTEKGTILSTRTTKSKINLSPEERRHLESSPILVNRAGYDNTAAQSQNGNVAGGDVAKNITLAGFNVPATRRYWVSSITFTSSVAADLLLQVGNGALIPPGTTAQRTLDAKLLAGQTVTLPFNDYVPERSGFFLTTNSAITGGGNFKCSFVLNGAVNLTNETNLSSEINIGCFADSLWTATGPTYGNQFAPFIVRDWYISGNGPSGKSVDVALTIKGNGGYNFANIIELLNTQGGRMGDLNLLILAIGMNDAVAYSATPALFQASMAAFISWRNTFYKGIPLIICGPTPRQDAYETSGLVPMRAWQSAYVTGLADSTVRYCDLSVGLDRTVNANYVDGTGANGVHLSAQGHVIAANNLKATLSATPAISLV